jgi:hypothetical protein
MHGDSVIVNGKDTHSDFWQPLLHADPPPLLAEPGDLGCGPLNYGVIHRLRN